MCWILRAQELRKFLTDLFCAGDEARFVRVQFESCSFQLRLEGQECFLSNIGRISSLDIVGHIIDPSLQGYCRVLLNQLFQWPVEDQLGDGWGLRTALQDASLIVLWFPTNTFSLNRPGA